MMSGVGKGFEKFDLQEAALDAFLARLHYVCGDPTDPATYAALKALSELSAGMLRQNSRPSPRL